MESFCVEFEDPEIYLRRPRAHGRASTMQEYPEESLSQELPLAIAFLKYAQSVPYSKAVNSCQDFIASARAAFLFFWPVELPVWVWSTKHVLFPTYFQACMEAIPVESA